MANLSGSLHTIFPILDSRNYDRWCIQMKVLFGFQEVLEVVTKGIKELATNAVEAQCKTYLEDEKKDCKALYFIHQSVDGAIFEKIASATNSKEGQDKLERSYKGVDKVNKVRL